MSRSCAHFAVGRPFMFIPINMIAYAGLPQQKTAQAPALINVAQPRWQHQRVARQHRIGAALAISSIAPR